MSLPTLPIAQTEAWSVHTCLEDLSGGKVVGGGTIQDQVVEVEVRQGQTMACRWKCWAAEGHQAQEKERGQVPQGSGHPLIRIYSLKGTRTVTLAP